MKNKKFGYTLPEMMKIELEMRDKYNAAVLKLFNKEYRKEVKNEVLRIDKKHS